MLNEMFKATNSEFEFRLLVDNNTVLGNKNFETIE